MRVTLGERIKNQRKKSGLSQERVAELVEVSRQSVTKWESGQSAPSTENLFKLTEIFGTTVDMLLEIPDEKNAQSAEQTQIGELTAQIQYLYRVESARKAEAERVRIENEKRIEEIQNKSNKVWLVQILFVSLCVIAVIPLTIAVFSEMNPTVISVCAVHTTAADRIGFLKKWRNVWLTYTAMFALMAVLFAFQTPVASAVLGGIGLLSLIPVVLYQVQIGKIKKTDELQE